MNDDRPMRDGGRGFFRAMVLMGASVAAGCGGKGVPRDDTVRLPHPGGTPNDETPSRGGDAGHAVPKANEADGAALAQDEAPDSEPTATRDDDSPRTELAQGDVFVDEGDDDPTPRAASDAGLGPSGTPQHLPETPEGLPEAPTDGTGVVDVDLGYPNCPPERWTCTPVDCSPNSPLEVRTCTCDSNRPTSKADCAPDEQFVCHTRGLVEVYDASEQYQCACVAQTVACWQACHDAFASEASEEGADGYYCGARAEPDPRGEEADFLCGCAYVYLR